MASPFCMMWFFSSCITDRGLFRVEETTEQFLQVNSKTAKALFSMKCLLRRKRWMGTVWAPIPVMTDTFLISLTASHSDVLYFEGGPRDIDLFFSVRLILWFPLNLNHFCVCCSQLCFQMKITIRSHCWHQQPQLLFSALGWFMEPVPSVLNSYCNFHLH